ncbi:HISTONE H1-LIKE [Salix koriyanagi]|uniref:HISTONE H1-LIKE n=1 Tax=Salix koriyanagi TaxID=2511006 RepID=A0A9Q0WD29_9ROSI|nr:HISTONE H1-LIKE [Salix koriyanagi]
MDPPPPSLSIPPPAPPSIPPPQPATVTTTITPTPTTNETPPFSSSAPPYPPTISLPSYAEMIYSAITALKEQDGSSRIAIAKYIERAYPDLTITQTSVMLQLLQLLFLITHPRFSPSYSSSTHSMLFLSLQLLLSRKGAVEGPLKLRPTGFLQLRLCLLTGSHRLVLAHMFLKGRGRPKKVVVTEAGPLVKKGRGRPPNSGPLGSKKSTGRPRKPKSLVGAKKSPGRPPKNQLKPVNVPYAVAAPTATDAAAVFSVASPKPRGRPRKGATPTASATGAVVMVQAKQPGRPAQVPGVMKLKPKPRKSSGRPVGRPRKVNAVIFTRIRV